jgi:outer membrane protein TolC
MLACCALAGWCAQGFAQPAADLASTLPPAASTGAVLAQSPAYRAAQRLLSAESAVGDQLRAGPAEWTGTVHSAQRRVQETVPMQTREWELGLDRAVRWPGKTAVYERAAQARVAMAASARHRVWLEQARSLLERHGLWLREREAARVWAEQSALLLRQLDAVSRRQALGEVARLERELAEAAWVQARVQAQSAESRAATAREALERSFPGLDLSGPSALQALPAPPPVPEPDAAWFDAVKAGSPDIALARREVALADAQARVEQAEQRPDPTVGVRVGQARSGGEHFVGVVLSLPFGGAYRDAGALAAAERASAAALRLEEAERRVVAEALQRLREAQTAQRQAAGSAEAAARFIAVAEGLQRSYQLGEGQLGDVVAARRLANEQRLAAAVGTVEAWMAQHRLALEMGALWPEAAAAP